MLKKLVIVLIVIMSVLFGLALFQEFRHSHKYVEVDQSTRQTYINMLNSEVRNSNYTESRQEMRALLEAEMDFHFYIYHEASVKNGGDSISLIRLIVMDKAIDIEQYCILLCHEMCHIKYFTGNEIYTQFMTFKTLYESDNPTLRRVGTWLGIYVLNGEYKTGYDCSAMIVEYLKG